MLTSIPTTNSTLRVLQWTVENLGRNLGVKAYSDTFDAGGYPW